MLQPKKKTVKPAKTIEKYVPTARQKKNIEDAKQMKNMRPVFKSGGSLGMKSVKAGYDKNPGVTRADIITAAKGKAKSGASMKKAKNGTLQPMGENSRKVGEGKYVSEDGNYKLKFKGGSNTSAPTSAVQRRTLKGFLKGAPKAGFKTTMAKTGASVKKCKYGCK